MTSESLLTITFTFALSGLAAEIEAAPLAATTRFDEATPVEATVEVAREGDTSTWSLREVRVRSLVASMELTRRVERLHEIQFSSDGAPNRTLADVPAWVQTLVEQALRLAERSRESGQ